MQEGAGGRDDNRRRTGFALQRRQRGQPGLASAVGPGDALEGQAVGFRVEQHRWAALIDGGQKVADPLHPLLGLFAAASHNHQRAAIVCSQSRSQKGPGRAQKCQRRGAARFQQLPVSRDALERGEQTVEFHKLSIQDSKRADRASER